jgi:hypothetical protein
MLETIGLCAIVAINMDHRKSLEPIFKPTYVIIKLAKDPLITSMYPNPS